MSDIHNLRKNFEITITDQRQRPGCYAFNLEWSQPGFDLAEVYLFISQKTFDVVAVETVTSYGDKTLIEFSNIIFDTDLDDVLFEFDIPIDADIISLDQ